MPYLSGALKHCKQQSESTSGNTFKSSTLFTIGLESGLGVGRAGRGISAPLLSASSSAKIVTVKYATLLACFLFASPRTPTKLNQRSRQRNYDCLVYVNRLRSGNHPSTFFWHREELIALHSYRQSWVRQYSAW